MAFDEDIKEKLASLMAQHLHLEKRLRESLLSMTELVWDSLQTVEDCEELLEYLPPGELKFHVMNLRKRLSDN